MCGIAGLVGLHGQHVDEQTVRAMADAVSHRGPDGNGVLVEANVGLGHRRLAIVELSRDADQPMTTLDRAVSIVFNGEIYNYIELRDELSALGHTFRTHSDTEVILAAYLQWGKQCVVRFNGMWSFALYDRRAANLFCSRDRFGEKPFYFVRNDKWFAFGSEIRQLLPFVRNRRANSRSLFKFILGGFAEDPDQSFFDGISKLPAGHNLVLNTRTGSVSVERYYEIVLDAALSKISMTDAVNQFASMLDDSVRLRLRADVPIATCLSGGLDSSSVAVLAARRYLMTVGDKFSAITALSEQLDNDESSYAAQVVAHSNLNWHTVKPGYADFINSLSDVVETQEEPFPSPSICMQYFVMRDARVNSIPVLLDGQGGDEVLLGYERYFAAHVRITARRAGISAAVNEIWSNKSSQSITQLISTLAYFNSPNMRWLNYRRRNSYLRHFPQPFPELRDYASASSDIFTLQKLEIERTCLPALLRYEDKNAMRHAIETRLPFLDYRLVEFALSLPSELKLSDGWSKNILRRAMVGKMPESIVWRRNKLGFEAPERIWLKMHYQSMLSAVGKSELLAELCDQRRLMKVFERLDKRTQWRLYSVALWEQFFKIESAAG
jgi:asparagine synthase (glutamine-hydrolysing)